MIRSFYHKDFNLPSAQLQQVTSLSVKGIALRLNHTQQPQPLGAASSSTMAATIHQIGHGGSPS
jgi:hypothetical protein